MRLIDADALIEQINSIANNDKVDKFKAVKFVAEYAPTIEAEPAQRWIPCAEKLPEVYEKVLTYSDDGIIHDNFRLNLRDGSIGWSQGWGITHWKPRPEPPKGGDEDD